MTTVDMMDIRDGFVTQVLQPKLPGITISNRPREASIEGTDDQDRRLLMGYPARYAEFVHIGDNGRTLQVRSQGTSGTGARFRFEFMMWYGFEDDPTYADSTQKGFDDLIEHKTTGLLPDLRERGFFTVGGDVVDVGPPEEVRVSVGPDMKTHYLHFLITLSNQL